VSNYSSVTSGCRPAGPAKRIIKYLRSESDLKAKRPACALAQAGRLERSLDRSRTGLRVSSCGSRCTSLIFRTRISRQRNAPLFHTAADPLRAIHRRAPRRDDPGEARLPHACELAVGEGDHRVRFKGSCWSLTENKSRISDERLDAPAASRRSSSGPNGAEERRY